jgi:flavin reductase (DIM6/NTAB) family NADH-FMN oxidoreductase RutF
VVNLPSEDTVQNVNALARTTGRKDVPAFKAERGYRYEKDKFGIAGLTPVSADLVRSPRIQECPVHMEAEVVDVYELFKDGPAELQGCAVAIEVKIVKTYVRDELRLPGYANRIDPDKWKPIIMSFQNFYGLKDGKLADSTLAKIDEESYRV